MVAALVISMTAAAYAANDGDAKQGNEQSEISAQIELAGQLVDYGYANSDALALIQAVKIYQKLNLTPGLKDWEKTQEKADNSKEPAKEGRGEFSIGQLLDDATTFADGDKTLLALIKECKKETRSPVGGPAYTTDRVYSHSTNAYTCTLKAGEVTTIELKGDGSTDLDLYVYDMYGNLITYDESYGDYCYASLAVYLTSKFTIKVVNRGNVYNDFVLVVY